MFGQKIGEVAHDLVGFSTIQWPTITVSAHHRDLHGDGTEVFDVERDFAIGGFSFRYDITQGDAWIDVLENFAIDALDDLPFLKFANLHTISAKKRQGLGPVWKSITQAHKSAMVKMTTPVLTRLLLESVQFQSPQRGGMFRPKLRYAHQGGMNPPVIVIHGNSLEHVTETYKRYLEGRFRKAFDLSGTPLRIEMKTSQNPYADKDSD